jgi:hypothetical protein
MEAVVAYYKALFRNLPGRKDDIDENLQAVQSVSRPNTNQKHHRWNHLARCANSLQTPRRMTFRGPVKHDDEGELH